MHWERFKEQATQIHSKFFFKRAKNGYEVWDVAQIYGKGYPRKYKCMVIPYRTNSIGFTLMLKKLRQGNWNRRMGLQAILTEKSIRGLALSKKAKQANLVDVALGTTEGLRRATLKAKQEMGITKSSIINNMKGMGWDDANRAYKKIMEAKGVYK